MKTTQKPADDLLREMSNKLGLPYEPQDWGVSNADGNRLDEFVAFFQQGDLQPSQLFELADLILASANERLVRGLAVEVKPLEALARKYGQAFSLHLEYWSGLEDAEEFPLASLLRRIKV